MAVWVLLADQLTKTFAASVELEQRHGGTDHPGERYAHLAERPGHVLEAVHEQLLAAVGDEDGADDGPEQEEPTMQARAGGGSRGG